MKIFLFFLRFLVESCNTTYYSCLHIRFTTKYSHRKSSISVSRKLAGKFSLFIREYTSFVFYSQTFWLIYILSYIPRRTNLGYLYRNPDMFNTFLCFLLISALSLQTISQSSLSPEVYI